MQWKLYCKSEKKLLLEIWAYKNFPTTNADTTFIPVLWCGQGLKIMFFRGVSPKRPLLAPKGSLLHPTSGAHGGALGDLARPLRSLMGCQKKKKKKERKGKEKERKTEGKKRNDKATWWIGRYSSTSRGARRGSREENFRGAKLTAATGGGKRHSSTLLQGAKINDSLGPTGGGSAILQLCSRAPNLTTHWAPRSATSWICPSTSPSKSFLHRACLLLHFMLYHSLKYCTVNKQQICI